jgi:hypothetical protein
MLGLTRTAVVALAVALGLAIVGVIMVQRFDARLVDTVGLACVLGGVIIAALTNTESHVR